jgi:hypothetical protein
MDVTLLMCSVLRSWDMLLRNEGQSERRRSGHLNWREV